MSILKKLSENHIVSFELTDKKTHISIMEVCDFYYSIDLSKNELKQLINELTLIYQTMSEDKTNNHEQHN